MRIRSFLRKHLVIAEAVGLLMLLFAAYIIGQRIILPLRENKANNSSDISGEYEKNGEIINLKLSGARKPKIIHGDILLGLLTWMAKENAYC